jgi:hypothetical protein
MLGRAARQVAATSAHHLRELRELPTMHALLARKIFRAVATDSAAVCGSSPDDSRAATRMP